MQNGREGRREGGLRLDLAGRGALGVLQELAVEALLGVGRLREGRVHEHAECEVLVRMRRPQLRLALRARQLEARRAAVQLAAQLLLDVAFAVHVQQHLLVFESTDTHPSLPS